MKRKQAGKPFNHLGLTTRIGCPYYPYLIDLDTAL